MRRVRRRQQVPHEEDDEDQFNGRADRVVLVAGLDVADKHGRARHLLEGVGDLVHRPLDEFLGVLELHLVDGRGKERHTDWRGREGEGVSEVTISMVPRLNVLEGLALRVGARGLISPCRDAGRAASQSWHGIALKKGPRITSRKLVARCFVHISDYFTLKCHIVLCVRFCIMIMLRHTLQLCIQLQRSKLHLASQSRYVVRYRNAYGKRKTESRCLKPCTMQTP